MKRLAAAVLLLLADHALAQGGAAPQPDDADTARAAMRAGDYAEAYHLWRGMAATGDADAMYNLGWMYHNGYGLVIDDAEALRWWEQAAAKESVDALYALGNLLRFGGRGVPVDGPRAVDYFLRAAQKGDDEAALLLRTLIARNDPSLSARRAELISQHAAALGAPLVVRKDNTGFRKGAAVEATMLAVFPRGKRLVELSRRSNGWVQAGDPQDGRVGWLKATLVEPAP
jgi:TPR repeat protein